MPAVKLSVRSRHSPDAKRRRRVLIADDERVLLDALGSALVARGYIVVGAAENGRRAVALAREQRPDVAVLDSSMPVMGGLDAARQIIGAAPEVGVVLLTGGVEEWVLHEALRIGVHGFVVKTQGIEDLLQAIRDVSSGAIYISPLYSRTVVKAFAANKRRDHGPLTFRELQVLTLIADGKATKQAAAVLAISVRTAECHRAHIMDKLHIHDTAGLVRYAIRQGLIVA
jgi:DNA-binding NarL/FixJ family response regulator